MNSPEISTAIRGESLGDFAPEQNLSHHLTARAAEFPDRCAVRATDGSELTFEALEKRCDAIARGLCEVGLGRGDRCCLFVRPGHELIAVTHALFRSGIVPVLIDPGMGRKNLLSCVERIAPRALIGVPRAQLARVLFPRAFRSVEIFVTVGRRFGWSGFTLANIEDLGRAGDWKGPATLGSEEAAILFTSGSTGAPKGVAVTFEMFEAQLRVLQRLYGLGPGGVSVACFPLFALFDNALGMTSVFPKMDPSKPGTCDPALIHAALESSGATFTFGSPAIWRRVLPWMQAHGKRLTSLRSLTIAGAPVPPPLVAGLRERMDGGEVFTPYGATEALPVSNISGAELAAGIAERSMEGEGTCVGRPAPGIEMRLIGITDEAIERWSDELLAPAGEAGEIVVRGPVVTHEYRFDEKATRHAKIHDGDTIWHRMGDVGRFDDEGRLWFHGRKSHRLETEQGTLMPVPIENRFNPCRGVRRTALVGVGPRGAERPHLVVETEGRGDRAAILGELETKRAEVDPPIEGILFHKSFPVDVRHNAKIRRDDLKGWAEEKTGERPRS
jgi:olefin beta-lactone synthetase